jgi:uncharacterized protein YggU (UPF0235/DUF167 family)
VKNKNGYRILVTVHPGTSKKGIEIKEDGVHLYTTSKPIRGQANREAQGIIASYFQVHKRNVSLYRGERARHKIFQLSINSKQIKSYKDTELDMKILNYLSEV